MLLAAKPDDDDELPAARGHGPLGFNYMLGGARRLAFISYRRADSAGQTGRIHDHLKSRFGPGRVFRDITIPPGLDWRQRIETSLIDCVVVITVIGNGWVCKRLSHPDDLLRHELEVALQRNIGVIPVLVDGATLPRPRDLPTSLRGLLDAQALEIHEEDFDHDIRKLIDRVREFLAPPPRPKHPIAKPVGWLLAIVAGLANALLGAAWWTALGVAILVLAIWVVADLLLAQKLEIASVKK